jgi:hypothetical protein
MRDYILEAMPSQHHVPALNVLLNGRHEHGLKHRALEQGLAPVTTICGKKDALRGRILDPAQMQ